MPPHDQPAHFIESQVWVVVSSVWVCLNTMPTTNKYKFSTSTGTNIVAPQVSVKVALHTHIQGGI